MLNPLFMEEKDDVDEEEIAHPLQYSDSVRLASRTREEFDLSLLHIGV